MRDVVVFRRGERLFAGRVASLWSTGERLHLVYHDHFLYDPTIGFLSHVAFDWPWQITVSQ
jgi:hypothetical protein